MQDRASFAPSVVIIACDDLIEVTVNDRLVRFMAPGPSLVAVVRRSVAFRPLWDLLAHLTSPDFWPEGESELTLPADVLETVFRRAWLLDAA
ncbi:hypothetical protein [Sabulicella glaciei]|uniref:Uncharacterized protein n=1 Tax=Sabulicella glaciei TaxID=2984948 RepID=A0ABT3P265_9PROT|nr:hypothetical protein [Roseococcus sp. MDT2-1-1]MCW8088496.1 hypothetical protein [Roseococcus sp. MDT2-1-1]